MLLVYSGELIRGGCDGVNRGATGQMGGVGPRSGKARALLRRAEQIEAHLFTLWDDEVGAFVAASQDCRQIDVWANAYALNTGFPLGSRRAQVRQFLVDHYREYVWHGQVRHLLNGQYWQSLLTPVAAGQYQNGAYWATASGWVMTVLAEAQPALARHMFQDLLADFQQDGVCECVNEGYRQLPSYVVSATNPLGAARNLGF